MKDNNKKKKDYGKIDKVILAEALASGMSMVDAGKLAGSEAKDHSTVSRKLARDDTLKAAVIKLMGQKRKLALKNMTENKAKEASFQQLATSAAILTDKMELMTSGLTPDKANQQLIFRYVRQGDTEIGEVVKTALNTPIETAYPNGS